LIIVGKDAMNTAPRRLATRLATTALGLTALAALIASGAAAFGGASSGGASAGNPAFLHPMAFIAVPWLMLVGWGFHALLGRHLRMVDRLAYCDSQLGIERHARQLAERAQLDTHTSLCRLINQQDHVRENERNRIARDIHDDLGQHLLAFKIELSLIQAGTGGAHPLLHQHVGRLLHSVDLAIRALRIIINNLRPLALEQGLQSAIETHLSEFSRLNGIRHELDTDPVAFGCNRDGAVDAMLFRILQESLANVVRHAQATEVKIALNRNGDQLTLKVRDNGIGMAGMPASRGCGLAGIADRVAAAGGRFAIDSEPGAGTLLSLSIPLARLVSHH
jgi:signal transduction histidine kinase